MNKPQIKQMIASQIKVICKSDKDMAISRWKRAKAFYEIFSMIVWAKSPYKSFESFVKEEFIDINPGSARIWVIHYTQMSKWYTWPQIQTMTKSVAYTRATQAQQAWSKTKNPAAGLREFIAFAKSIDTHPWKRPQNVPNPNRISLTLPILYVDKFEGILASYGYIIPKDRNDTKHGISDALVKYLDSI